MPNNASCPYASHLLFFFSLPSAVRVSVWIVDSSACLTRKHFSSQLCVDSLLASDLIVVELMRTNL